MRLLIILACLLTVFSANAQDKAPLAFGVLNQRSATLTAEYWNPILRYVSEKSGVPLQLKMGRSAWETTAMIKQRKLAFLYSNHTFIPENDVVGYRVIARPKEEAIASQIVVLADSNIKSLDDLRDREIAFPSNIAFVGYFVPLDALLKAGIKVKPIYAGNQEGAMAQLKSRAVPAAALNSVIASEYANREGIQYRVIWTSDKYHNMPISAHPSVPQDAVQAVRTAFINMVNDPVGQKILADSAAVIKQKPPFGFVAADEKDYQNYRDFFAKTVVPIEP